MRSVVNVQYYTCKAHVLSIRSSQALMFTPATRGMKWKMNTVLAFGGVPESGADMPRSEDETPVYTPRA